ncbi:MAG: hypothetical protein HYR88_08325, partial [Verrucomicrobia bacterium]|nr:hypothetical protein [Verrucomicrobiota bacterium]
MINVYADGARIEVPPSLYDVVGIAAAVDKNLALTKDGRVIEWSTPTNPVVVLTGASQIYARYERRFAILSNGTGFLWRSNKAGFNPFPGVLLVSGAVGSTKVIGTAEQEGCVLGVDGLGNVYCSFATDASQAITSEPIPGISNVVAVAGGWVFNLALMRDGRVQEWMESLNPPIRPYLTAWPGIPGAVAVGMANVAASQQSWVAFGDGSVLLRYPSSSSTPQRTNHFDRRISQFSVGDGYPMALLEDGTVKGLQGLDAADYYDKLVEQGAPTNTFSLAGQGERVLFLSSRPAVAPKVVEQSRERSFNPGNPITLETYVEGVSPIAYQWTKEAQPLLGAIEPFLRIDSARVEDVGDYRLVACNPFGCVTSDIIRVVMAPAPPQVQSVTSLQNAGDGSLREAIHNANATGGGEISLSNLTGNVLLTKALPVLVRDISLLGPGAYQLLITGSNMNSAVQIDTNAHCLISGLSFSGLKANSATRGAAISNVGSLKVLGCRFENNSTVLSGGAVFSAGEIEVRDTFFRSNSVLNTLPNATSLPEGGAGVGAFRGRVTLIGCVLTENTVTGHDQWSEYRGDGTYLTRNGEAAHGGAIYLRDCISSLLSCTLTNNRTLGGSQGGGGLGGAILVEGGTIEMSYCNASSNHVVAQSSGNYGGNAWGGGLCIGPGVIAVIDSCSICRNSIRAGDGSAGDGFKYQGNPGRSEGGGFRFSGASLRVYNSTLSENQAFGSEFHNYFPISCADTYGSPAYGAGMSVNGGEVLVVSSTISGNIGQGGAGSGRISCYGNTTGTGLGGGIANVDGKVSMLNTIVAGNV